MPSPIAHLGAGYAIYRYYKHKLPENRGSLWKFPRQMLVIMGLSLLPDADIIAAIIFSDMQNYHNNFSHSLLLAIPVAFLFAGIFHGIYGANFWLWFLICLVSYDLHVIMDALTGERGVMLFWPFSQTRIVFPIRIFYGLQWGEGWFSTRHLWTVFTESLFVLVLTAVVNYFDKRKHTTNAVFSQKS